MDREILFRGKRRDNGEWVYGSLIISGGIEAYIMQRDDFDKGYSFGHVDGIPCYPVDPETVGQFTGLKDRNDTKIFEGDIVLFTDTSGIYSPVKFGEFVICEVTEIHGFYVTIRGENVPLCKCPTMEILGNTFDNPELLEGD